MLRALDADGDPTNGVKIDAAANTAVAAAVAGGKTVNFDQAAAAFAADPVIAAVLADLNRQLGDAKAALLDFTELFPQSRSSSIALTGDDTRAVVANRQKSSVSVIRVRNANGTDAEQLLAEVTVGKEPRFVAISPDDKRAYVTNAVDGTMCVIDLTLQHAGSRRRAGRRRRRAARHRDHAERHVRLHRESHRRRRDDRAPLERCRSSARCTPAAIRYAIAITNDGDRNDDDERVFVTQLFGEVIDPARPDGFDDAKQGVVDTFTRRRGRRRQRAGRAACCSKPLASGFNADRRQFCPTTRDALDSARAGTER